MPVVRAPRVSRRRENEVKNIIFTLDDEDPSPLSEAAGVNVADLRKRERSAEERGRERMISLCSSYLDNWKRRTAQDSTPPNAPLHSTAIKERELAHHSPHHRPKKKRSSRKSGTPEEAAHAPVTLVALVVHAVEEYGSAEARRGRKGVRMASERRELKKELT